MVRSRKNKASERTVSVSSEESQNDKLDTILEKLSALDSISAKLSKMEKTLAATQAENVVMKETIKAQDVKINNLQNRLNNLEQHGRSFSIRVNNLALEEAEERDPPAVINKVYNAVLLPIL
jgi:predicted nuclease with TOPRIM domain